jgi:hypothetical protein
MCPCDRDRGCVCDWCERRIREAAMVAGRRVLEERWAAWKCEAVLGPAAPSP